MLKLGHLRAPQADGKEPWERAAEAEAASAAPRRIAWSGGKIKSNKEEALFKFLRRKQQKGEKLTPDQTRALATAVQERSGLGSAQRAVVQVGVGESAEVVADAAAAAAAAAADASDFLSKKKQRKLMRELEQIAVAKAAAAAAASASSSAASPSRKKRKGKGNKGNKGTKGKGGVLGRLGGAPVPAVAPVVRAAALASANRKRKQSQSQSQSQSQGKQGKRPATLAAMLDRPLSARRP